MARTARTDTTVLALPDTCRRWLGTDAADRSRAVHEQAIAVDLRWWNTALSESGAPGGPLQIDNAQSGQVLLTRRQVFTAAADLSTSEAVWRLLWLSMAWGTGSRRRLVHQRMRTVAADPHRYVEVLAKAADCSRTDPGTAYALLYPDNRTRIPFLGPAFFTKFLYFAGAGNPAHPSLILDSRVATALHRAGWTSLRSGGRWPADTYRRYTALLARWATEQSASTSRTITSDVLERWLFDHGR
ncbi:hypothetical protein MYP14_25625 (plasmid) [Rhodococcus pyridinivorans]|uniref:8-oxoguanine DNA glycosylase OGG fold protein n=1 Tax=Rhodococcus pyridinivorans TaxID=103816 RepID=UPI001FFFA628|nr:hypothetical protein [Rhodococcus pyridinivorans]UPK66453.1 hypothetical protein MYP14_25625 [Rhodococcus pyridinivorans]